MAAATIIFFERKVKESLKKSNSKKILDNLQNNRQIYGHQFDNFYSFSIAHKRFYIINSEEFLCSVDVLRAKWLIVY